MFAIDRVLICQGNNIYANDAMVLCRFSPRKPYPLLPESKVTHSPHLFQLNSFPHLCAPTPSYLVTQMPKSIPYLSRRFRRSSYVEEFSIKYDKRGHHRVTTKRVRIDWHELDRQRSSTTNAGSSSRSNGARNIGSGYIHLEYCVLQHK